MLCEELRIHAAAALQNAARQMLQHRRERAALVRIHAQSMIHHE